MFSLVFRIWVVSFGLGLPCICWCSSLKAVLGIDWDNYEDRGVYNEFYLTKDFGQHVLRPLLQRVSDELLEQRFEDANQNIAIMCVCVLCFVFVFVFVVFLLAGRYYKQRIKKVPEIAQNIQERRHMHVAAAMA